MVIDRAQSSQLSTRGSVKNSRKGLLNLIKAQKLPWIHPVTLQSDLSKHSMLIIPHLNIFYRTTTWNRFILQLELNSCMKKPNTLTLVSILKLMVMELSFSKIHSWEKLTLCCPIKISYSMQISSRIMKKPRKMLKSTLNLSNFISTLVSLQIHLSVMLFATSLSLS